MKFQKTIRIDEYSYKTLHEELPAGVSYCRNSGAGELGDISVTIYAQTELELGFALGLITSNCIVWDDTQFPMKSVKKDCAKWLMWPEQKAAA